MRAAGDAAHAARIAALRPPAATPTTVPAAIDAAIAALRALSPDHVAADPAWRFTTVVVTNNCTRAALVASRSVDLARAAHVPRSGAPRL